MRNIIDKSALSNLFLFCEYLLNIYSVRAGVWCNQGEKLMILESAGLGFDPDSVPYKLCSGESYSTTLSHIFLPVK